MSYLKWLITTLFLILIFAALVVAVNFYVDHHGVRLSLFGGSREIHQDQVIYPDGINQHMFNPELVFRNPEKFDSFLFGSSRTSVIHVEKIPEGRFYNMSYSLGLPTQHLAILKAFVKRGIKIKRVIIGLDEIAFAMPPAATQKHLVRIMHPDIGGPGRLELFGMYFFRKPDLEELGRWYDRVVLGKMNGRIITTPRGLNLVWMEKDRIIEKAAKPVFYFDAGPYKPVTYDQKKMDEAFQSIEELVALAQAHHFQLTFFISPIYSKLYLNNAEALLTAKARLAQITDYYDFSGFNSVTTNPVNYYEEVHYRYRVGDMIIARIFGVDVATLPKDFGVLVTKQNVGQHLENQKRELEQYLKSHSLK
ncbi:MAG: hypothetical protein CVU51_08645 [Deltaproteobacteria bacterium HGW-Deltaproteobacteria-1]|jgi:hypothetical protein|nr:MAG: hypothetical protein CVU51_08645 [Deltaproteobacteria bacterium HGW-Deltaproteobacteria-1]